MNKDRLLGKNLNELEVVAVELGLKKYCGRQICDWIYKKHIESVDQMTNLSLSARQKISEKYDIGRTSYSTVQCSVDGTKKYLFETIGGSAIESAYIPDRNRATLCVSSQSGCRMGCLFCMTARGGFNRNLSAGEILNQIESLPERDTLTNIVFMGMGEPLDNYDSVMRAINVMISDWGYGWSPSRITLSTIGIVPAMVDFIEKTKVHLAVSLHNPFSEERIKLMPAENRFSVDQIISAIKKHDFSQNRRVSFEYIMFKGLNDSPRHIKQLVKLLSEISCRVNLIRFHKIPDSVLESSDEQTMVTFRDSLSKAGIVTTIRSSRGEDIFAACGMLSGAKRLNDKK